MCSSCETLYPIAGDVPCLVPEPARYCLAQFRNLEEYLAVTQQRKQDLSSERRQEHLLTLTRERLRRLTQALDEERALVQEVMAELVSGVDRATAAKVQRSPFPAQDLALLECHETTFRDWAWGEPENDFARDMVARLALAATNSSTARAVGAANVTLGKLAVFGAGACRLAVDVHRTLGPSRTFALDLNPLPVLIASRILRGETIEAYEYPLGPHGIERVAVLQQLRRSFEISEGITLLLADATRPPFASASLDTVLTPWFIDVVGRDVRDTAAIINRVLEPGGLWINQGPLRFVGRVSSVYCIEEVHEIVQQSGFEIVADLKEDMPYFNSPISGSRRTETVYGFAARKIANAQPVATPQVDPLWATDLRHPIPRPGALTTTEQRFAFNAHVLSLVDGERSLADLAETLSTQLHADPQALVEPLRAFLLKFFQTG